MNQQNNKSAQEWLKEHFPGLEKETWYPVIVAVAEGYSTYQNNNPQQAAEEQSDEAAADNYLENSVKPNCVKWNYDFNTSVYVLGASKLGFLAGRQSLRAQQQENDDWISIDERLPESEGLYLAYVTNHPFLGSKQGVHVVYYGFGIDEDLTEMEWSMQMQDIALSHWKPLPQPPKTKV